MAITKTTTVERVEVYPGEEPRLMVVYTDVFDDPDDDLLPNESSRVIHLNKTTVTVDDDGNEVETATDVSGHDALVQSIAAAVWTD